MRQKLGDLTRPLRRQAWSVASQMASMRIIAVGLVKKQSMPLHFLLASSPRLRLLNEALRFESPQEEPDASLSMALP